MPQRRCDLTGCTELDKCQKNNIVYRSLIFHSVYRNRHHPVRIPTGHKGSNFLSGTNHRDPACLHGPRSFFEYKATFQLNLSYIHTPGLANYRHMDRPLHTQTHTHKHVHIYILVPTDTHTHTHTLISKYIAKWINWVIFFQLRIISLCLRLNMPNVVPLHELKLENKYSFNENIFLSLFLRVSNTKHLAFIYKLFPCFISMQDK